MQVNRCIRCLFCSLLIFKVSCFTWYRNKEAKYKSQDPRAKLPLFPCLWKHLPGVSMVKHASDTTTQRCAPNTIRNSWKDYRWPCQPRQLQGIPWVPGTHWGPTNGHGCLSWVCSVSSSWTVSVPIRLPATFCSWAAPEASSVDVFLQGNAR